MRNKAEGGSPIGLLDRSAEHAKGAVFVAIAYRASVTRSVKFLDAKIE